MSSDYGMAAQPLEAGIKFFILNVAFILCFPMLMVFIGVSYAISSILSPVYLFIWLVVGIWAYRRVGWKGNQEGDIKICPGPKRPRRGVRVSYSLCVASIPVNLINLIASLFPFTGPGILPYSFQLIQSNWYTAGGINNFTLLIYPVGSLIFLIVGFIGLRNFSLEIESMVERWASPIYYDAIAAAQEGHVLLGHGFKHVSHIEGAEMAIGGAVEPMPDKIKRGTRIEIIGTDGPFIIDLKRTPNANVGIVGPPGTGKTKTLDALCLRYWVTAPHIPFTFLDWTGEQADFVRSISGLVWSVPDTFKINLLKLGGKSPQQRRASVEDALIRSLGDENRSLTPLQAHTVGVSIDEEYRRCGILQDDPSTWDNPPPTMQSVIENMRAKQAKGLFKGQKEDWVEWVLDKLDAACIVFGEEPESFFDVALQVPLDLDLSPLGDVDTAKLLVIDTINRRFDEIFNARKIYDLRLLLVLDEAHVVFTAKTEGSSGEPRIVRNVRFGRKFGISSVFASHSVEDFPRPVRIALGTVIAHQEKIPEEVTYMKKWLNLSPPELNICANLPRGGAFVGQEKEKPALVKVQMVSNREITYARQVTEQIVPKDVLKLRETIAQTPGPVRTAPKPKPEAAKPELPVQRCPKCNRELRAGAKFCDRCGADVKPEPSLKDVLKDFHEQPAPPKPPGEAKPAPTTTPGPFTPESKPPREMSPLELRIHRALMLEPTTMHVLQAKFPETKFDELLNTLHALHEEGLIQIEKVANLVGKGTTFYAALKAEWLQSESLEHRAMVDMIEDGTITLRPLRFPPTHANFPDIGLELAKPKTAIEAETGRKKLTPEELDAWAQDVKGRNAKHDYERTIVVVPNAHVKLRYMPACQKHGLELATMSELLALLGLQAKGDVVG
jgi:hypothetical protein